MNKRIVVSILLVLIWVCVIYIYSNMDSSESNSKSKGTVNNIIEKIDEVVGANEKTIKKHQSSDFREEMNYIFRKICHAIVYFTLAILVFNMLIQIKKMDILKYNIFTILICFLYACIDEYHQTFVDGRTGQFFDVIIDMVGVCLGCLFISIICKIIAKRKIVKNVSNG